MGYMSIDNLYKYPNIFLFKEVYALEKIHGTSAHLSWDGWNLKVSYYAGGCKTEHFKALFNDDDLTKKFKELGFEKVTIYGEAYGGKMQGMGDVYGPSLKFVVFDVLAKDGTEARWQSVPEAERTAQFLGLEFVDYEIVKTDTESLDVARNKPSVQSVRNGILEPQQREGIVLRPLIELKDSFGGRIIAKYKTENFRETKSPRQLDPSQIAVLSQASEVADEWVTAMRMEHILGKSDKKWETQHTGAVVKMMIDDIRKESKDEIVWSKEVEKSIGKITSRIYQEWLKKNG